MPSVFFSQLLAWMAWEDREAKAPDVPAGRQVLGVSSVVTSPAFRSAIAHR